MKKNIKKKLVLTITTVLAISAVLSFTGCAGSLGTSESMTKETETTTAAGKETEAETTTAVSKAKTDTAKTAKADSETTNKADNKVNSKTDSKSGSTIEKKPLYADRTETETETTASQGTDTQNSQSAQGSQISGSQTEHRQEQSRQENTQSQQSGGTYNEEPEYREPETKPQSNPTPVTPKKEEPQPKVCTDHKWVLIEDNSHMVEAVTHEEPIYGEVPVYGTRGYWVCGCGNFTLMVADECGNYFEDNMDAFAEHNFADGYNSWVIEEKVEIGRETQQTGTKTVVDVPGYFQQDMTFRCSNCGEIKHETNCY